MEIRGLIVVLTVLAVNSARVDAERVCSGPFNTLKSACQGVKPDQLCIEYDLRDGAPSPCDDPTSTSVKNKGDCQRGAGATCDIVSYNAHASATVVRFYVTFTATSSFTGGGAFVGDSGFEDGGDDEADGSSSASGSGGTPILVGGGAAFETDAMVNAIGELQLPAEVNELRLIGGRSETGTQGRVATVDLDPYMLRRSQQVTSFHLFNLDIGEQLVKGDVIDGFPSGVEVLSLSNVMLRNVPQKLSLLPNLDILAIEQNYLTTFPSDITLPRVTTLRMRNNGLTSFDAVLPALTTLDLIGNELQAIPDAIFELPKLNALYLSRNPISSPIVLTAHQVAFLRGLSWLDIDPPSDSAQPILYPIDAGVMPLTPTNRPSNPAAGSSPRPTASANSSTPVATTGPIAAVGRPIGTSEIVHGIQVWLVTDEEDKQLKSQQAVFAVKAGATNTTSKKTTSAKEPWDTETDGASDAQHTDDIAHGLTSTDSSRTKTVDTPADDSSQSLDDSGTNTTPSWGDRVGGASGTSTVANRVDATNKKLRHTWVWASAVGGAVVASIVVVLIFVLRRRRSRQSLKQPLTPRSPPTLNSPVCSAFVALKSTTTSAGSSSPSSSQTLTTADRKVRDIFSARRLRQADLQDVRPINASASGVVWLVRHRGSRLLASKRLVSSNAPPDRMTAFINEIVVVSELEHPSITSLVGVAWSNESDLQALFEYMPNGDLQSHLERMDASAWPWDVAKIRLAIDIVDALVYAHSFNPPLLHRDLRTRHVLLDEANKPKLSGFGSARYASENNTMTTEGVGSGPWLAPEILMGTTDYDSSSDMYAFGVLLCEMDTHATPYGVGDDPAGVAGVLEQVATGKLRPTFTSSCPSAIREVASRCWCQDASARPTAVQVAFELRELAEQWEQDCDK